MEYRRFLDLAGRLEGKSTFLFGPRSTGKTSLWKTSLNPDRTYDLLNLRTFRRLLESPSLIFEEIQKRGELVVIDEVQKIPQILDEVHRSIEEKKTRFLLTGSSPRKLLRTQGNLLGGRASMLQLLPLTWKEVLDFDLIRYLNQGGIPRHYLASSNQVEVELDDYVSLYLKEEIMAEAVTRNLEGFHRFLEVMANHSGDELSLEGFSSDSGIKVGTFRNYLEVLKDTLIGFEVPSFTATKKRKAITRSKIFLFDVGITGFLSQRGVVRPKSPAFGKAFEHFIAMELIAYCTYMRKKETLSYWRSTSQFEVDFLLGRKIAIEVKGKESVTSRDLNGLQALKEEGIFSRYLVVSLEETRRKSEGIEIWPWREFLSAFWNGEFI